MPGGQIWKAKSKAGRKPIFKTPEALNEACEEYFQWVDDNPLMEQKLFSSNGAIISGSAVKMRAMTIQGLCNFLDISDECWSNYCKREGFVGICARVKRIIYAQKLEGAAADLLNPSIIARELGLADKQEHAVGLQIVQVDKDDEGI